MNDGVECLAERSLISLTEQTTCKEEDCPDGKKLAFFQGQNVAFPPLIDLGEIENFDCITQHCIQI